MFGFTTPLLKNIAVHNIVYNIAVLLKWYVKCVMQHCINLPFRGALIFLNLEYLKKKNQCTDKSLNLPKVAIFYFLYNMKHFCLTINIAASKGFNLLQALDQLRL